MEMISGRPAPSTIFSVYLDTTITPAIAGLHALRSAAAQRISAQSYLSNRSQDQALRPPSAEVNNFDEVIASVDVRNKKWDRCWPDSFSASRSMAVESLPPEKSSTGRSTELGDHFPEDKLIPTPALAGCINP